MATTYSNVLLHIVFSTKLRRYLIRDEFRDALFSYLGGIVRDNKCRLLEIGGMPDHVHLLLTMNSGIALADLVRQIKASSSKWVNTRSEQRERFAWQTGYAAFSVSHSQTPRVREYIQNQAEHHRAKSFDEEFLELLTRHAIEFDPRYTFDPAEE